MKISDEAAAVGCYNGLSHSDRRIFWTIAGVSKDLALKFLVREGSKN
jgi:hypothetical protein